MKLIDKLKRFLKRTKGTLNACVLCLRFPFLYPRNRFNDLHYTNWKIKRYLETLQKEAFYYTYENKSTDNPLGTRTVHVTNRWKKYWYHIVRFYHNVILQIVFCIPTYTELDDMPDGWRKAFGIQMCKEISRELIYAYGIRGLFRYRIMQIKEKFGTLRWYDGNSADGVFRVIDKYEDKSYHTCISCGKPAVWLSTGWISPYCNECIGNTDRKTPLKS